MDRFVGIFVSVCMLGIFGTRAVAEVVFVPSQSAEAREEYPAVTYPVSRFGSPPQPLIVDEVSREPSALQTSGRTSAKLVGTVPEKPMDLVPSQAKGVQEVALIAGELGYFPKALFVTQDIPVRLFVTGTSEKTLCIMMDSFNVRKQIRSRQVEEVTFTPGTAGKYRFYCPVNGMEGTLVVRESTVR